MRKKPFRAVKLPSSSSAIALIALFVALGGVSWAVTSLPANSVGTVQLKNGAVVGAKIQNGSIGAEDMSSNGIGSSHTMTSSGVKVLGGNMVVGSMPLSAGSYSVDARIGLNDTTGGTTVVACTMSSFLNPGGSTLDFDQRQFATSSYAASQGYIRLHATASLAKSGYIQLRCQRTPEVGSLTVVGSQAEAVRVVAPQNTVFPLN